MSEIRKLPREQWQANIACGNLYVMFAANVLEDGSEWAHYAVFPLSPGPAQNPISIEDLDGVELRINSGAS
ncbi:hypothetical protein [Roseovarius nubinhibens]|uniref:Uncharacterized protein n=1 Tax=Roseovarius nubinhibens TaxID=314263 RepID=A0A348W782_9RHOB|nr:hypothetical protein [Roseovarius nubinhibens]|tara:strand:+ start:10457 stop:10669 length:213 start_codon:yes stop_codon:yes gene_type:complete